MWNGGLTISPLRRASALNQTPFRIITYKPTRICVHLEALQKSGSFRINTYKKPGGGVHPTSSTLFFPFLFVPARGITVSFTLFWSNSHSTVWSSNLRAEWNNKKMTTSPRAFLSSLATATHHARSLAIELHLPHWPLSSRCNLSPPVPRLAARSVDSFANPIYLSIEPGWELSSPFCFSPLRSSS
jgi:hypothetical protein